MWISGRSLAEGLCWGVNSKEARVAGGLRGISRASEAIVRVRKSRGGQVLSRGVM